MAFLHVVSTSACLYVERVSVVYIFCFFSGYPQPWGTLIDMKSVLIVWIFMPKAKANVLGEGYVDYFSCGGCVVFVMRPISYLVVLHIFCEGRCQGVWTGTL